MKKIGITGHQILPVPWDWTDGILGELIAEHSPFIGYSSLAKGTDERFAELLLGKGMPFIFVQPCRDYELTFTNDQEKAHYCSLASKAKEKMELMSDRPSSEAFLKAGKTIVDTVDMMIAVWDALPAKGPGGTAEIVAYAVSCRKPLIHIDPIHQSVARL